MNTVHRAGRDTQVATSTFILNNRVHLFSGTENCIYRTGLYAQCAANTGFLIYINNGFFWLISMFFIQGYWFNAQQVRQCQHGNFSPGRALVDIGFTTRDGFCIRSTARVATLSALRLGKQGIYFIDDRVTFYMKPDRGIAEQKPKQGGNGGEGGDSNEYGHRDLVHQPDEAHESKGHYACGDHGNRIALEYFRNIGHGNALTNTGEQYQYHGKAQCRTEAIEG